jgi:hypothetical protein
VRRGPPDAAAVAFPTPANPGLLARALGVIRHPRVTLTGVGAAPHWAGMLTVSTVAAAAAVALFFQTGIGRQALVDQWERTAIAFGQSIDDGRYAELLELSERGWLYGVALAVASGPVLSCGVAALVFVVFNARGGRASFRQVLAVVVHAGVILTLRQIVAAPVSYARETTASATSLGIWFPMFDPSSPMARFLSMLDLFVVWWAVVLAIGIAALYGRRARSLSAVFIGVYIGIAVTLAAAMALLGGTS